MKKYISSLSLYLLLGVTAHAGNPLPEKRPDGLHVGDRTIPWSEAMSRSEMTRSPQAWMIDFSRTPKWSYTMGLELGAILETGERYDIDSMKDYALSYADTIVGNTGRIATYRLTDYNLDQINSGKLLFRAYDRTGARKYRQALDTLWKQLQEQPRTAEGGFWHKKIYPHQMWLDGIYMASPFLAEYASRFVADPVPCYDDVVRQLSLAAAHTYDSATGLFRHAWDESRLQVWAASTTGQSSHTWGRALGWYSMALVDVLDFLPHTYPARDSVVRLVQRVARGIAAHQDPHSGLWYQVMECPNRPGNYLEATCSAMFCYSLYKAVRKGYLPHKYLEVANKGFAGIVGQLIRVDANGTISLEKCCAVAGLGGRGGRDGSFTYYIGEKVIDNDPKGVGPFIKAALEAELSGAPRKDNTPIDRRALVTRHDPVVTRIEPLNSLSVGNGRFAFTADATGLQTFPETYATGVPLGTQSEWGWHSFPNPEKYTHDETLADTTLFERTASYAIQSLTDRRKKGAAGWFRINPHRLHLGIVGLELLNPDGTKAIPEQLTDIRQQLHLWEGVLSSSFEWNGKRISVETCCSPSQDKIGASVSTSGTKGCVGINIRLPYPTGGHSDDACDWNSPEKHLSEVIELTQGRALLRHTLDTTTYYVEVIWTGNALFREKERHYFTLTPQGSTRSFSFTCSFLPAKPVRTDPESWNTICKASAHHWEAFWKSGAAIDFSACTDPRAAELERRVVLSQYLTAIQCTGLYPPAESGLTYNTWFGRPHLEMHWWHGVHFVLWNRPALLESTLEWYRTTAAPKARSIARRQHYDGIRWMKMTDPQAGEAPSDIGSFLIWQQPHFIYFAELMYRAAPTAATLDKYAEYVAATAEFMYSFASYNKLHNRYELRGIIPAQETAALRPAITYNPPFELAYWHYGLEVAQRWRERCGHPRDARWDKLLTKLSPLAAVNGLYVAAESHPDSFEDIRNTSDHMAALGALGVLPQCPLVDPGTMAATFDWVWKNWHWEKTWGWDFPMTAMTAARLGKRREAVDALLLDQPANTYLISGHNCRDQRLRVYLPGNGGLLTAVAMMCTGWNGAPEIPNPGFPQDGSWNVRWENLQTME